MLNHLFKYSTKSSQISSLNSHSLSLQRTTVQMTKSKQTGHSWTQNDIKTRGKMATAHPPPKQRQRCQLCMITLLPSTHFCMWRKKSNFTSQCFNLASHANNNYWLLHFFSMAWPRQRKYPDKSASEMRKHKVFNSLIFSIELHAIAQCLNLNNSLSH